MSINFDLLMSQRRNTPIRPQDRAADAWSRIQRNPVSVAFTRPRVVTKTGTTPATVLAAQTVRIESDNRASAEDGIAGTAPIRQAIVYGICNHATLPDTDMEEGYTFAYQGDAYRCIDVKLVPSGRPGEKQGTFVVNG